jgi:TPR repeat protein
MYHLGDGVPQDDEEAVRWFRLAAEQGDADAQFRLGLMYATGEGVPEDDVLAYMWWNLAAAQGNEGAQAVKDLLEEQMTRAQIAEVQRLFREWIEAHPPGGNWPPVPSWHPATSSYPALFCASGEMPR